MTTHADISIVIVSYNVSRLLADCIVSIEKFRGSSVIEIIVVDNNSSDGTVDLIRERFPQVKLIANQFNAGFSEANNQGMKIASGEFIFLLNPDTVLTEEIFGRLMETAGKETCIVAPQLRNADNTLQPSCGKFPTVTAVVLETFYLHRIFSQGYNKSVYATSFHPDWASGAALFFSIELYRKTKGLDPSLFWMDDVEFCYRARNASYKVKYFPDVSLIHLGGGSSAGNEEIVISNQLLSRVKFFRKHRSLFVADLVTIFICIHAMSRIVIFSIGSVFSRSMRKKASAYVSAFKKLMKYIFTGKHSVG